MRTREERNAALLEVPEHLRELTKRHCLNAWNHPARQQRKEAEAHEQLNPNTAPTATSTG
jgi:hypothetical protein